MRPAVFLWSSLTGIGIAGTVIPGFAIVRGPFFGGALLEPVELMIALGVLFVGFFLFAGAGSKLYAIKSQGDGDGRAALTREQYSPTRRH